MIDHIFKEDFDPNLRTILQRTILAEYPENKIDLAEIKDLLLKITY
jgi:hypothetical protein